MSTFKADPVISELWAVRDAIAARFNYDPAAISRDVRSLEGSFERAAARFSSLDVRVDADGEDGETVP